MLCAVNFIKMTNEIEIQKGQEANKLLLMRELMQGLEDMFETVKNEDADSMQKFFGADDKIVSKKRFKAKLVIEVLD
ncbi:MAG: hypothetical protein QXI16_03695 [Sulfolobaceae archaeon]